MIRQFELMGVKSSDLELARIEAALWLLDTPPEGRA